MPHTWDTVALALGVSLLCIDLPGHGHSDSAAAFDATALPLQQNAADIAAVIRALAPQAKAVVGMSLGGLTTLALARDHAELVRKLVLVDITPGVNQEKTKQNYKKEKKYLNLLSNYLKISIYLIETF